MDSRLFIASAQKLIAKIESGVDGIEVTEAVAQKEVTYLFAGLTNPTLPTALKLRDVALNAGLTIAPGVLQRLHQGEGVWSFGI